MWSAYQFWSNALSSWATMAHTGAQIGAMSRDSAYVVDRRTRLIAEAMRNPMEGDYAELSLMVPEKVAAFSKAGLAGLQAIGVAQADHFALWQKMLMLAAAGKPMTPADGLSFARQSARASKRAAGAPGRIIAPVHKGATDNAKRLRQKKVR